MLGRMSGLFVRFCRAKSAATAIEYGLIAALIAAVIVGVLQNTGTKLKAPLTTISTTLH